MSIAALRIWRWVWFAVALGFVVSCIVAWPGRAALRKWQYRKTIVNAESALADRKMAAAALGARQALTLRPLDSRAIRVMARVAAQIGNPEMLIWQRRLC